jgi:type I site-specific restriction endonuclease
MNPEERAREKIDELLEAAGWVVQDRLEAYQTFGTDLNKLLEELNEALAA